MEKQQAYKATSLIEMPKPFTGSLLKLDRAAEHLMRLKVLINDYLRTKPMFLVVEKLPGVANSLAFVARVRKPVPPKLSCVIGDIVHNLRACLDLMACDLVRLNGHSDEDVYFPFSRKEADFEYQFKKRRMHCTSVDVQNLIREMKPYSNGNELLRAVHDLDIHDKHRSLIPAIGQISVPTVLVKEITTGRMMNFNIPDEILTIDGQPIGVWPNATGVELGQRIPCEYKLVFDIDMPLSRMEVLKALHSLHENISSIVEAFRALCVGLDFSDSERAKVYNRDCSVFMPSPENFSFFKSTQ